MLAEGLEWDQVELPSGQHPIKDSLVTILAFRDDRTPELIGTGFIIQASKARAIAVTAAHNFEEVRNNIQSSGSRSHATALPEFVGDLTEIDLQREKLRASCTNSNGMELAVIDWAAWDKDSDIALFGISTQEADSDFFNKIFRLANPDLKVGDSIKLLGFSEMGVTDEQRDGQGYERFSFCQTTLIREGVITNLLPKGRGHNKGRCIETSIPTPFGMSGGPAVLIGEAGNPITPFGIISRGFDFKPGDNIDRSKRGNTIVALLDIDITHESEDSQTMVLNLNKGKLHKRDDWDVARESKSSNEKYIISDAAPNKRRILDSG